MQSNRKSRRRFIQLAGTSTVVGIAGCSGAPSAGPSPTEAESEETEPAPTESEDEEDEEDEEHEELPEGVSEEEFENGPVPEEYVTAISIGGETRNPEELLSKAEAGFSEYDDALEQAAHQPGFCCGNCEEYIADKNGDGFGACARVEGYIDRADWCTVWEELPEPVVPEGLTEDELATAEVPEEYRTAVSQAGEERDPENLLAQADVLFGESVEQIADGVAQPGMSCATCAEFIPDKNGDGWGACAAVEGYIAVEDWCSAWEAISEEL